jgi:hypothetical protein
MSRLENVVSRFIGKILFNGGLDGIPYGFLGFSAGILALILLVIGRYLPAEKKNKFFVLIVMGFIQLILGIKRAEAGFDLDLNKKPMDLNEEPESSESNNPQKNPSEEAAPSAPVDSHSSSSIAYEEMGKLKDECQEKILRCWRNEPKYEKRRLNPSGSSMDASISAFILQRWQGSSLESIRSQRNELSLERGSSEIYMEFRAFLERCNT